MSRIDNIGQNGNDGLHYEDMRPEKRELNPCDPPSAYSAAVKNGFCSDGRPCGEHHAYFDDYCADCPNEPNQSEQPLDMVKRYPKYYKDVRKLSAIDVYAIHELFDINDPSGCIQHASKKLLLCGVRTGGKDVATEIKEARDTLTRKLQLMGVE